jgi:flagellar basal body-associated protein FliL
MTEPPPRSGGSKRVSPLAVIIVVIVIGLIAIAVMHGRNSVETPPAQPNSAIPGQPNLPPAGNAS